MDGNQNMDSTSRIQGERKLAWLPDLVLSYGRKINQLDFKPILPKNHAHFLEAGSEGEVVVCGGRGMGKSTLIAFRASILNKKSDFEPTRNTSPFGFFMLPRSIYMHKTSVMHFQNVNLWEAVWKLVLALDFCGAILTRSQKLSAKDKIEKWNDVFSVSTDDTLLLKLLPHLQAMRLSPHVGNIHMIIKDIIDERPSIEFLETIFEKKLLPLMAEHVQSADRTLFTVIDGFDEAINISDKISGAAGDTEEDVNYETFKRELWVCSQAGLGMAALSFRSLFNFKLLPLVTLRSESLEKLIKSYGIAANKMSSLYFKIEYSDNELKKIFCYNVHLMDKLDQCNSFKMTNSDETEIDKKLERACKSLCGYAKVRNRSVMGVTESVYSMIFRHSFNTPRSIVTLGGVVAKTKIREILVDGKKIKCRDPQEVMTALNSNGTVFEEFLTTRHPVWDSRYAAGFGLIKKNLISSQMALDIDSKFDALPDTPAGGLIDYLYTSGLLGIPDYSESHDTVQQFYFENNAKEKSNPPYFLVHSAFASQLSSLHRDLETKRRFYDGRILVSKGELAPIELPKSEIEVRLLDSDSSVKIVAVNPNSGERYIDLDDDKKAILVLCIVCLAIRLKNRQEVNHEDILEAGELAEKLDWLPDMMTIEDIKMNLVSAFNSTGSQRSGILNTISKKTKNQNYNIATKRGLVHLKHRVSKKPLKPNQIIVPMIQKSNYLIG